MRYTIKSLTALALVSAVGVSWAAGISLYQAPDVKSTVATQVKTGQRLIPIYQSKDHKGWIKVANPADGKVGWMKMKSATDATHPPKAMTQQSNHGFEQRVITTTEKDGPKQYKVIEYSGSDKLNHKQVQKLIQSMERRNAQMQADMNRMMNDMRTNFFGFQPIEPPVVERVVLVPVQADAKDAGPKPSDEAAKAVSEKPQKKSFWQKIKGKASL
ncbi:MAG: SH3 domain-containing protein [Coxiellaceae bacterium]|nr:SH3 domain-containing protein [Coxiellaceae bacterium]